jgi:hypothetical protein
MQSNRFIHGGGKYSCKSGIAVAEYPLSRAEEQNLRSAYTVASDVQGKPRRNSIVRCKLGKYLWCL